MIMKQYFYQIIKINFLLLTKNGLIKWEQTINSYLEPTIIENLVFTVSEEGLFFCYR